MNYAFTVLFVIVFLAGLYFSPRILILLNGVERFVVFIFWMTLLISIFSAIMAFS